MKIDYVWIRETVPLTFFPLPTPIPLLYSTDSWSTDVVASDFSEPPESSQMERLEEIAEEVLPQGLLEVASGKTTSRGAVSV